MSNYIASDTDLTAVANAIRAKSGGSSQLAFPAGFVSEIGNIPSGGGKVLLATYTASEDVSAIQIDYTSAMDGYTIFILELEGYARGSSLYICPQINDTTKKTYDWLTAKDAKFHRYFVCAPAYSNQLNTYQNISKNGFVVATSYVNANAPISYFYVRSFYDTAFFSSGTVAKIWGVVV